MNAIATTLEHGVENIPRTMRSGMRFLRGKTLYHNTNNVFAELEKRYHLASTAVMDTTKTDEVEKSLENYQGNIIAIFYETATNPSIEYTDTRAIYKLAHSRNIPIIVDNTFLTPYLLQPLRMGADVVIHSMTKYFNGLGNFLAGAAIGPSKFVRKMRVSQTDFGNVFQSPAIARLFYDQLASLDERMELYVKNAKEIAATLQSTRMLKHKIEKVLYPEIKDTRYNSAGGVLSFILKGKDDQEKIFREARLMQYCARSRGPSDKVVYSVGFGDNQYRVFGENTWNETALTKNHVPGLVRLATGTSNAEYVIPFLRTAFDYAYQLKQFKKSG
jgi:methionine-gamma-lyase